MDHWHSIRAALLLALIAILLPGCTFTMGDERADPQAVHADLAARLAETRSAQAQALDLWDRVLFGEQVSCQDAIPAPALVTLSRRAREAHPQAVPVQDALNAAITAVHNSADLWSIECAETRDWVPLVMAREGRANALAATDALDAAAALLDAWQ